VKPDRLITAINRYRTAMAELDKIAVREPTLPNGNPADETEEYAVWETANHKARMSPQRFGLKSRQHSRRPWPARLRSLIATLRFGASTHKGRAPGQWRLENLTLVPAEYYR